MRFYGYFRSTASYRCRIALNLKGVAPEFIPVHLRRGGGEQHREQFRAVNPQGLVPALDVDGQVLTQSLAIIEWLDREIPDPPLIPGDSGLRAEVTSFALAIAADIHPLNNLRVLNYLREHLGQGQAETEAWCRHWCEDGLTALEIVAERSVPRGAFLFDDRPGLAEICLVPQLSSARRFGVDLGRFSRLLAVEALCLDIPAFQRARPELQPDAEP
ncbi:maleylacetoacetate isomerase [Roseiarcus fermentans]|nr:maleylacetoacetate isomerase [Roseiarcus fermentans]